MSDTSTITISPEYAAHFLEVYVKKTDGAKFTGDRIRFLMLSLPLAVRDLIAPEVYTLTILVYTQYIPDIFMVFTWCILHLRIVYTRFIPNLIYFSGC